MGKCCRVLPLLLALTGVKIGIAQKSFPGLDARSLGYGGSGVIAIRDPSALAWNPASIGLVRETDLFFSYKRPFQIDHIAAAGFVPFIGTFAANVQETPTGQSVAAGWAYEWPSRLVTGAAYESRLVDGDRHPCLAFGLLYHPAPKGHSGREASFTPKYLLQNFTMTAAIQGIALDHSNASPLVHLAGSVDLPWRQAVLLYALHLHENDRVHQLAASFSLTPFLQAYAGISDFDAKQAAAGLSWSWQNLQLHAGYHLERQELLLSTTIRLGASGKELSQRAQARAQAFFDKGERRQAFRFGKLALAYDEENENAHSLMNVLAPSVADGDAVIDSLLKEADELASKRWYLSAATHYMKVLKLDPENSRARAAMALIQSQVERHIDKWFQLGRQYVERNEPAVAREVFDAILQVRPDHEPSRRERDEIDRLFEAKAQEFYFQGLGYYSQKNWDSAEEAFKQALALRPEWQEPQSYLWHVQEQRKQSHTSLEQALEQAARFEKQGDWINARKHYRAAAAVDPNNRLALAKLDELQTLASNHVERQYARAEAAYRGNDTETARRLLTDVLELAPNHAAGRRLLEAINRSLPLSLQAMFERANRHAERNEHALCIEVADSLLEARPQMAEAQQLRRRSMLALDAASLLEIARKRFLRDRYSEALPLIQEALNKEPNQTQAASLLAQTLKRMEAQVDAYFNRGIAFFTQEKYTQAIGEWDKALAINPNHQGAREFRRRAQERIDALNKMP
ncbi:MAG TPA: tetratricopeptide repeat protein [bacterium]|nr:tetratricopeptide repeat protein [bacterium]